MHGSAEMTASVAIGVGVFFLLVALLNVGFVIYQWSVRRNSLQALVWTIVGAVFLLHAAVFIVQGAQIAAAERRLTAADDRLATLRAEEAHTSEIDAAEEKVLATREELHHRKEAVWEMPFVIRYATNRLMGAMGGQMGPIVYTLLSVVGFFLFLRYYRPLTAPIAAWTILNVSLFISGWAITDPNFRLIVTKEDNVPIVLLVFTVGFFTWMAFRQAAVNDERLARGEPPLEKLEDEKVLVWPDLVYTEMIAMIVMTFILVVWAVALKAPLEPPATTEKAPNPSKAPWYFLGLQEMLVYYDPWLAGVVFPTMIIIGLMAIPYIDFNQKGNGYFTFAQRKFSVTMFLFGFIVLWVTLIVLGTFLRGPNWNFFSPFEPWDPHKVLPLNNVNLSDYFWLPLGVVFQEGQGWFLRELPGIVVLLAYFLLIPPLLAKTVLRSFFIRMGFIRFFLLVNLLQFMALLPLKMILRWAINLKYIVYIPEYFFNI